MYEIVTWEHGAWQSDPVGADNDFATMDDAEVAVAELAKLGEEWAATTYGIREIGTNRVTLVY